LRKDSLGNPYNVIGQVAPKKIDLINKDIKNQSIEDGETKEYKKDTINYTSIGSVKSDTPLEKIQKKEQSIDANKPEPREQDSYKIKGPVILHKREEINTVGSDKKYNSYKNVSMGGVLGSFNTPFSNDDDKDKNIIGANIEMPTNNDGNINISKEDNDKVKTINYSDLKSDTLTLPKKEIESIDIINNTTDKTLATTADNKTDDDKEIIDLSSMDIINK